MTRQLKPDEICETCCIRCRNTIDHWTCQPCDIYHVIELLCKKCNS